MEFSAAAAAAILKSAVELFKTARSDADKHRAFEQLHAQNEQMTKVIADFGPIGERCKKCGVAKLFLTDDSRMQSGIFADVGLPERRWHCSACDKDTWIQERG